jgi:GDPmannose 4,6-dehydratase
MSKPGTVLVTGVSGQDGTYLAERLLAAGHAVVGVSRDPAASAARLPENLRHRVAVEPWDLRDVDAFSGLIERHRPSMVFNLAAFSTGRGMFDDAVGIGDTNGLAVARMLESIRTVDPSVRFCQASSSEMYGATSQTPQSELTPFRPRSPYAAAKLYAHSMVATYRERYDLFACSAILFNHESPRRGEAFVTRKISRAAAMIKLGLAQELQLGNLDSCRDWGFAGDYVEGMHAMLAHDRADDFVLATGEVHSVREFCELAFGRLGLDYRDYVRTGEFDFRPSEQVQLCGDAAKARTTLGWSPRVRFRELVHMMVDSDLQALQDVGAAKQGNA